jgi:hypothetical protein
MSIKDLFDNKGVPKIQKTVTSDELVAPIESEDFVEAKRRQFDKFIPPIDFTTASNFAKFGSAELYYEKSFERIHNLYPYDGTLHEKIEFENSSSYLDRYIFDNVYPRTNGYLNFATDNTYISVQGGPHTASVGMDGKALGSTFDLSMKYDEEKKRTSAFEFRGEDGITAEFWLKVPNLNDPRTIFHISGSDSDGYIEVRYTTGGDLKLYMESGSSGVLQPTFAEITDFNWNYYAVSVLSSSAGITVKGYKNGQLETQVLETSKNIPSILPRTGGLNMRIGRDFGLVRKSTGSLDEFRFWKSARTPEQIFNNWFIPLGGGTNKHDANVSLGCYFKFNEGKTGNSSLDSTILDYSGRINNGQLTGSSFTYVDAYRSTGSAITEKLNEPEFKDPIIYSSHPDIVSKKAEYKTSGSLADLENNSTLYNYFPGWMQETDTDNGKELKHLSQIVSSYFDNLWHEISFVNKIDDMDYPKHDSKPIPFASRLLLDRGFVVPDLFVDANVIELLKDKDDNEVYEKKIFDVKNAILLNIYNNLNSIYKSKGTEKSFRNLFNSIGLSRDLVKLRVYADDSTFVLRNNYENSSYERKFIDFNKEGHFDATIHQTSSANNSNIYIPGDKDFTGSFTLQAEVILPRKQRRSEPNYFPYPYLTASIAGYHTTGSSGYTHPTLPDGLQIYVVHSASEGSLGIDESQRVKFVLTGSQIKLESPFFNNQYNNNKWSVAVRMKHATYPTPNITGSTKDDYLLEFYGVEANGNTERNTFLLSMSSVAHTYYSSDKIFYAGAHKSNFTGTTLHHTDVKLGYLRYWHSYLSNDAIKQHAFDSETFGANEPFEQDLANVYPVEIPREKTLAFHWAFHDLTASNSSGEFDVSDLSSGSSDSNYGTLSNTIQRYVAAKGFGFDNSSSTVVDRNFLFSAKKRLPDDLMSSDLTTIKSDETENFFVDEDVSDHFYSFEKSMWSSISDEMMNMFSTALDLNNLIGQPNQKYHHRYNLADFLRNRFFDDVENEPDLDKFTSFYKWIDDSIGIALQQLIPASARFSKKINNVIESHVLERSKYVHQVPITTEFQSTEGSIKGVSELKYNWKFGHAPTDPDNESNHVLWQQDRKQKPTGSLREILRNSRNNHSIQGSGLTRVEIDGSTRISDTYAVRKFAKTYDLGMVNKETIHGGVNFGGKKNLQLFHSSVAPAGRMESVPQNIITVGVGAGSGIVQDPGNNDSSPRKKKLNINALIGNRVSEEYGYKVKGNDVLPMNIMSGTVNSGFNFLIETSYSSGVYLTNLHHDLVGYHSETSMQGPFTEQHVGGLQYRHIDLNTGADSEASRPEGWRILLKDHAALGPDADGALGFVGPDYETPYPSSTLQKANRYRDEHSKRPVNIRNIKTVSGSQKVGNYRSELDLFSVSPTFQKTWAIEAYGDAGVEILPTFVSSALPLTTHYQTLMGLAPYEAGNVFGAGPTGNRQPDTGSLTVIAPVVGQIATASTFSVKGRGNVFDTHRIRIQGSGNDETFEIDTNGSVSVVGANAVQTGSSDTDFFNNLESAIEAKLDGPFNASYSAFAGTFSKAIQWGNNGAVGLSITSSLGTELDSLPFTFSAWVDPTSNGSSVNTIYAETTSVGIGRGRVIDILAGGALRFIIHYVDSGGNKTDTYQINNFRSSYTGTPTHVMIVKGPDKPGTANASVYINGNYVAWTSTFLHPEGALNGIATINSPDLYHIGWSGATPGFGHTDDPATIDEVVLLNISCSAEQRNHLYNGGVVAELAGISTPINFSSEVVAYYNFEESLGDVRNNSIITDVKGFRNLVVYDNDFFDRITQVTTTLPILPPSASFAITPTTSGVYGNLTLTEVGTSFYNLSNGSGGVDAVTGDVRSANDNVITIPRTDLTGSQRNIVTRFSAPGGPEIQSIGYLDAYTTTYSVHNALPYRNSSVLGSGSGEQGTIRVEDHIGKRRGLKTLRALHMGQFGIDSQYGQVVSAFYPASGSFNKQQRNRSRRMEYSGSSIITGSNYDNMHINTPIPRSELQYSWIHNATSGSAGATYGAPTQRIVGYAPRDGMVSSSAGFVEAIVFPSASSIFGS